MLWFDQCFVGCRIDGKRVFHEMEKELAAGLRFASIKTEREFIESSIPQHYILGSLEGSGYYMLWFGQCFVGYRIDGNRVFHETEKELAAGLRFAAIKTEREFIESSIPQHYMLGSLEGSGYPLVFISKVSAIETS